MSKTDFVSAWGTEATVGGEPAHRAYFDGYRFEGIVYRRAADAQHCFRLQVHDDMPFANDCHEASRRGFETRFDTLEEARDACDAAAFAIVLVALMPSLRQWVVEIDAGLAQTYRQAVAHKEACWIEYEKHGDANDAHHNWDMARDAEADALEALRRGYAG